MITHPQMVCQSARRFAAEGDAGARGRIAHRGPNNKMKHRLRGMIEFESSDVATSAMVFISAPAFAQTPRMARNSMFLELGGNGAIYSVNYEYLLNDNTGLRFGGMASPADKDDSDDNTSIFTFTTMLNYLAGSGKHRQEMGVGALFALASDDFKGVEQFDGRGAYGTATIGYRLQPPDGGFVFRIGFTPIMSADGVLPWFGISFGSGV